MKVRKIETRTAFDPTEITKVTSMGNVIELQVMDKQNLFSVIQKLDANFYVDLRTGERKEFQHWENRAAGISSVKKTLANIRALVNCNVTEPQNCRWLTFTYAENMTDPKRLYDDFKIFWKRFLRWCKKNGIEKPEYISVIEPQRRGAWHAHLFFIWNGKAPFIPNDRDTVRMFNLPSDSVTMSDLWGQGTTKTKPVKDCDNIGAYFSAYLADMPLDEIQEMTGHDQLQAFQYSVDSYGNGHCDSKVLEKEFEDSDGLLKKKQFVKGGRLFLYPSGMNIYRTSRGIKRPEVEYMSWKKAEKKVCSAKQTFSRTYEITDQSGFYNTITKTYYNKKIGKTQVLKAENCCDCAGADLTISESVAAPIRTNQR